VHTLVEPQDLFIAATMYNERRGAREAAISADLHDKTSEFSSTSTGRSNPDLYADSVEMHRAEHRRSNSSSFNLDYMKVENPEDPERTPDIPEDLEHALLVLNRARTPTWDDRAAPKRQGLRCCSGVGFACCTCVVFALALFAGAALAPQVRDSDLGSAMQDQFQHLMAPPAPSSPSSRMPNTGSRGRGKGSAGFQHVVVPAATAPRGGAVAASAVSSEPAEAKPQPSHDLLAKEFCNSSQPIPQAVLRTWDVPDAWKRACERKNSKDKNTEERNWCWVGFNTMCHWNLKAHKPWSTFQEWAAKDGYTLDPLTHPFHPLLDPEVCDRPENGAIRHWTVEEHSQAREWFKNNVAVYVLSLRTVGDHRWKMIHNRLKDLKIWATRVPGVDMRESGALDKAKKHGFVPWDYNFTKAQEQAYTWKQNMGSMLGTVGCASAHFKAQAKLIADGAPLAVVMEDDSWPTDDFVPRLWSLVRDELPCDWEVTALLSRCGYGRCISPRLMRVMPDANEPAWRCHQGSNWGMHAVLYHTARLPRVQQLWRNTVWNEDRPHCMDVDVALASISDKVSFYAVPAVQDPGFVRETNHRSARWDINQAAKSTSTSTTTAYYVPTVKPGEPWPGAWNFG